MTDPTPEPTRPPSSLRYRLGMTAAIVVAVIALVLGVRATRTGEDHPVTVGGRSGVVEHLVPRNGAEALQQAEVGIDLAGGYEGRLILNGTAIPTDELRLVPEQNQVYFAPGEGKTFRRLPSGTNCVTAIVWKSADGRGVDDISVEWCFDVT
ncbi:MAG: hypothetical protein ABWZ76_01865 [Acidimicrobiales bacterium]